jgi:hypothetical protein
MRERPLYDPSPRQNRKTQPRRRLLAFRNPHPPTRGPHDLHAQAQDLLGPVLALTLAVVTGIEPQVRKAREAVLDEFHERLYAVAVEDVGRVDLRFEHQPLRVHQQVALRMPFTFLPGS